jgi:deoxyribonuclease V
VDPLIACVDVDWAASEAETEAVAVLREVAPYQPGEFYRRELPCLLAVLARGPAVDGVVVDGYVWLGAGRPGLGAHLHAALGGSTIVIGVAKSRFAGATDALPVYRGASRTPLYVTAAGANPEEAARWIASMHGPHRIPSLLKRVDRLARTSE